MTQNSLNQPGNNNNQKAFYTDSRSPFQRFMKTLFYTVWSVLGIMLIALLSIAVFGSGTWVENLDISEPVATEAPPAQQEQPPAAQQPAEPTEEQLACVADEVGEERLMELQQGAQPEADEAVLIQECLTE